jgi:hypothetical protein
MVEVLVDGGAGGRYVEGSVRRGALTWRST